MNSKTKRGLILGSVFMLLFLIMLMCVLNVDVRNIGAGHTSIGCSAVNKAFRNLVGVNMTLYKITDIMGIIVILIALIPVIFGVVQMIRRGIKNVDYDIWIVACAYAVLALFYAIFEIFVVNYRPVLMDGVIEASFPSSHTMLAVTILGVVAIFLWSRMDKKWLKITITCTLCVLAIALVAMRAVSGVHWLTDIIAGCMLGASIVSFYSAFASIAELKQKRNQSRV